MGSSVWVQHTYVHTVHGRHVPDSIYPIEGSSMPAMAFFRRAKEKPRVAFCYEIDPDAWCLVSRRHLCITCMSVRGVPECLQASVFEAAFGVEADPRTSSWCACDAFGRLLNPSHASPSPFPRRMERRPLHQSRTCPSHHAAYSVKVQVAWQNFSSTCCGAAAAFFMPWAVRGLRPPCQFAAKDHPVRFPSGCLACPATSLLRPPSLRSEGAMAAEAGQQGGQQASFEQEGGRQRDEQERAGHEMGDHRSREETAASY